MKTIHIFLFILFFSISLAQVDWFGEFPSKSESKSIVVDNKGNFYVLLYHNTSQFSFKINGVQSIISNPKTDSEILLIKYNAQQEILWGYNFPTTGNAHGYSMVLDNENNIYVTGYFNSSIKFKKESTVISNGTQDVFVLKYNENGELIWSRNFGGKGMDLGKSIAVDDKQNVYVCGIYNKIVNFNNLADKKNPKEEDVFINPDLYSKGFILKLNKEGNYEWVKSINTDKGGSSAIEDVAVDKNGNVYVTGHFYSTKAILKNSKNTIELEGKNVDNILMAKLSSKGDFLTAQTPGTGKGFSVKVDEKDNVIFAGGITGESYFDKDSKTATATKPSFWDGFLVKYNSNNKMLWHKQFTGGFCQVNKLAIGKNEHIYLTGIFNKQVNFENKILNSNSPTQNDIFTLVFDDKGKLKSSYNTLGDESDEAWGLCVDKSSGNYFISGTSRSPSLYLEGKNNLQKTIVGSSMYNYRAFIVKLKSRL